MTRVLYTVAFEIGSTLLSSAAKFGIEKALAGLTDRPTIILDSYADPSGDEGLNLALTTARAITVQKHMVEQGYLPHKILIRARGKRILEQADHFTQVTPSRRVELLALF